MSVTSQSTMLLEFIGLMKNSKLTSQYYPGVFETDVRYWMINGEVHREDGPAIERPDGTKGWVIKNKPHRLDGPAEEWPDGTMRYFINGREFTKEQWSIEREKYAL